MKKSNKSLLLIGIGICVFLLVFGVIRVISVDRYGKRKLWTLVCLDAIKEDIKVFKQKEGRYPNSLAELGLYAKQNLDLKLYGGPYQEFISNEEGNSNEVATLNGEGGWYYNSNTGEIRINLSKPLICHSRESSESRYLYL
jgi:hypothetical protein